MVNGGGGTVGRIVAAAPKADSKARPRREFLSAVRQGEVVRAILADDRI
jgi:hypothetical protein